MGTIKDRNGMDLKEAEDIKKRWQEYAQELCQKDLHDPDNQTSWNVNSSGALGNIMLTKLVEMKEFQLSYLKS